MIPSLFTTAPLYRTTMPAPSKVETPVPEVSRVVLSRDNGPAETCKLAVFLRVPPPVTVPPLQWNSPLDRNSWLGAMPRDPADKFTIAAEAMESATVWVPPSRLIRPAPANALPTEYVVSPEIERSRSADT